MTEKVVKQGTSSLFESVKWVLVFALVGLIVWGNSYYSAVSALYRAFAILGVALVAIFIVLQTQKGRSLNQLRKDSMVELRRVVWPTRQESLQTTLVVVVFVVLVAIALFVMDWILGGLVSVVIG